jgi:prepilin-type N-terminal cleavage/methylation domain-containing protein
MKNLKSRRRFLAGYSLPELLVVVAIIGMIVLVVVPNFTQFTRSNLMRSALRQFNSDIRAVRQRAVTQYVTTKISFCTTVAGCEVDGETLPRNAYRAYMLDTTGAAPEWVQTSFSLHGSGPAFTRDLEGRSYSTPSADHLAVQRIFFTRTNFTDVDTDGLVDIIFLSNGTVSPIPMPAAPARPHVAIQTNMAIPKPTAEIQISAAGQILAVR